MEPAYKLSWPAFKQLARDIAEDAKATTRDYLWQVVRKTAKDLLMRVAPRVSSRLAVRICAVCRGTGSVADGYTCVCDEGRVVVLENPVVKFISMFLDDNQNYDGVFATWEIKPYYDTIPNYSSSRPPDDEGPGGGIAFGKSPLDPFDDEEQGK